MKHSNKLLIVSLFAATYSHAQDTLKINTSSPGILISKNFTGMAYESDALRFDSLRASNHTLVQYFKTAGVKTFRLGGSSVQNYTYSPTSVKINPIDTVNNAELDSLFGFAKAVGCKIILGMNFSYYVNLPFLDAEEVSYVMAHYSQNLLAFEIGNEPNLYHVNGNRTPAYTYDSFQVQFLQYVDTIRKYTPNAPISGPASAYTKAYTFTNPFAHNMHGVINLLTQHYYAIPENVGTVSGRIDSLLSYKTNDSIKHLCDTLVMRADSGNVPFQMDECNALYPFSRWGVNNSFAASLWVLDYMYSLAEVGVQGINLHTIYNAAASVIQDAGGNYTAEPLYYGLLAFQLNNNGNLLPYTFTGSVPAKNLSVHPFLDSIHDIYVTLINKDTLNAISFQLYADSTRYTIGQMITLTAPKVSDTFGVTLGGNAVSAGGKWSGTWTPVTMVKGYYPITIPPATAIVVGLTNNYLGINELRTNSEVVRVYPDPNNGIFTIALSHPELVSGLQVKIYNVLGEEVYNAQFSTTFNSQFSIELNQPNGVYLYRVMDEKENLISNGKFVIQK